VFYDAQAGQARVLGGGIIQSAARRRSASGPGGGIRTRGGARLICRCEGKSPRGKWRRARQRYDREGLCGLGAVYDLVFGGVRCWPPGSIAAAERIGDVSSMWGCTAFSLADYSPQPHRRGGLCEPMLRKAQQRVAGTSFPISRRSP